MNTRPYRVHYNPAPSWLLHNVSLCGRIIKDGLTREPREVTCRHCQRKLHKMTAGDR